MKKSLAKIICAGVLALGIAGSLYAEQIWSHLKSSFVNEQKSKPVAREFIAWTRIYGTSEMSMQRRGKGECRVVANDGLVYSVGANIRINDCSVQITSDGFRIKRDFYQPVVVR